jgi:pyruvate/2-oxoglutarate dehydrogenase complex dihydrolipoamide acyltransferase (E2) component
LAFESGSGTVGTDWNVVVKPEEVIKVSANDDLAPRTSYLTSVQKSSGEKATSQQQYTGQAAQDGAGGVGNPDINFSASVKARELQFKEEPQTKVRFWGTPERNSVSINERKNLPEKVQQGVTYRHVSVRSRIASELVATEEEPYATNAARQKAERLGLDLHEVRGSGVNGRITYKDVRRAVQG